jgi:hypothetical protein
MRSITLRVVYLAIAALVVFPAHIVLAYAQLNLPALTSFVVDEAEFLDASSRAIPLKAVLVPNSCPIRWWGRGGYNALGERWRTIAGVPGSKNREN